MPFIQTALIHDDEENVIHCAGYRIRAVGSGNLDSVLYSLDSIESQNLASLTISSTNKREPTVLANFISQRIMLKLRTDAIDEVFDISRIIFFIKPIWSGFP